MAPARFLRFAAVGAVATCVQYAVLIMLVSGTSMAPTIASTSGFVVGAGVNYLLNYRFTFRSDRAHGPAAARFAVIAAVGLLINAGLMKLLLGAGWYYLLAQVCATGLVLIWTYTGNSLWTFGRRAAAAP